MKRVIKLRLRNNSYPIVIGDDILGDLALTLKKLGIGDSAVIVTNPLVQRLHGVRLAQSLKRCGFDVRVILVPDSEKSKSAPVALSVLGKIAQQDVRKKVFIVALGGGVIGDLAGFVAAIYKRGIPYVQVPTTLLAQIDSAIGGKVAIDLAVGKNLVGAFYQPRIVWSDIRVLKTLPQQQICSGLAEAVKYGVIKDKSLFRYIERNYKKFARHDLEALFPLIVRCSQIKSNAVMKDEKDTKGIRIILNFGHTIGHAIEAASGFHYDHGQAVALGMRVASDISVQVGMLSPHVDKRINALLDLVGLPKRIRHVTMNSVLKVMLHDKKFKGGKNRFVLAIAVGKVKVKETVPLEIIRKAVKKYS